MNIPLIGRPWEGMSYNLMVFVTITHLMRRYVAKQETGKYNFYMEVSKMNRKEEKARLVHINSSP